jgi:ComF family protein
MRLKYGRRIGLARLMAGYMMQRAPAACRGDVEQWLVLPVPLHRWRLWHRGFNQSLLIARHVARGLDLPIDPFLLRRVKSTRPLRNMNPRAREDTVRRAFAIDQRRKWQLKGKSIILIDDILTSGATARACSHVLLREGAAAVHLLCWARVNDMAGGD